jgi:hypothetical protein
MNKEEAYKAGEVSLETLAVSLKNLYGNMIQAIFQGKIRKYGLKWSLFPA